MGAKMELCALGHADGAGGAARVDAPLGARPVADTAARIKSVGARHFVLGTDLGQTGNPTPADGLQMFVAALEAAGITPRADRDDGTRGAGRAPDGLSRGRGKGTMRIEIICTGDEVLTGKIVNTNFSYISQKLEDVGLSVHWETTVGDDRESLLLALPARRRARRRGHRQRRPRPDGRRSVAGDRGQGRRRRARAERGVAHAMEDFFRRRSRVMPPNNTQAGDAARRRPRCSTTRSAPRAASRVDIGKARFFFTPGVPRELRRMLEEQVIPRLLAKSGQQTAIYLKRFHSYGIGESHVDTLLAGVDDARARRQREARLPRALPAARDQAHGARRRHGRHPAQARAGRGGGAQAARQLHPRRGRPDARRRRPRRARRAGRARSRSSRPSRAGRSRRASARCPARRRCSAAASSRASLGELCAAVGSMAACRRTRSRAETAEAVARAAPAQHRRHARARRADRPRRGRRTASSSAAPSASRSRPTTRRRSRRSRIVGGREWVRLGAVEMGLDCLRRYLQGLPGERAHRLREALIAWRPRRSKAAAFRALHARPGAFVIPNPWDAGTAKLLASLGFEALATTSLGLSNILGRPDGSGVVSREEVLTNCRSIAARPICP